MSVDVILPVAAIVFFFASVVLFFLGLSACIRSMKQSGEDGSGDRQLSQRTFKRSVVLCSVAVLVFIFFCFCSNYIPMTEEGADILTVALQSLWQGIRNTGFLILLPVVLRKWRNPRTH